MKSSKARIEELEARHSETYQVIFWEDLTDSAYCLVTQVTGVPLGKYHEGKPAERMKWAEAYKRYPETEFKITTVVYVDDPEGTNENDI